MLPNFRWIDASADARAVGALKEALGLSEPVARVLVARGAATPAAAQAFLKPELQSQLGSPCDFPGVRAAAERLWAAVRNRREIVVYGDFDADGVAAAAVLVTTLRRIGGCAEVFLPVRDPEGYGLTFAALKRCFGARGKPPDLLVTVDCGIGAVPEVAHLRACGVEVIVTDHHEPGEALPQAEVIVNPRLGASPGAEYLCGAGVAFKVAHALVELGKASGWYQGGTFGGELLTAVGLATVADIVPLTGENRALVAYALKNWSRYAGEGLRALLSRASPQTMDVLDAATFGFILGPRINAAGRMGSAMVAYELLTTRDRDRAVELAAKLEAFNGARRGVETRIVAAARCQCGLEAGTFEGAAVVVGNDGPHVGATGWHPGVIGIVAARLCEETGRPAAVVSFDGQGAGRGSVRAGDGYHALRALEAAREALEGFGGHARAAGFSVRRERFERFKELFCEACARQQAAGVASALEVSGWLESRQLTLELFAEQQRLAPFGMGNPTPRWGMRGVSIRQTQPMGGTGEHLQLTFQTGTGNLLRGVWFRRGNLAEHLRSVAGRVDVVFELARNDFGGEPSVELRVVDLAPASEKSGG